MIVARRTALSLVAAMAARPGHAQDFPSRPITVVVPFTPGALSDIVTRAIMQRVQPEFAQPIVVDNRAGGGTSVANGYVAQARPDGHTLLMASTSLATNPTLQPNVPPRDPRRDLVAIGPAYETPFVLAVLPDFPARDFAGFLAHARANPGRVDFGSSGNGAANHLALELMKKRADVRIEHIPYRGAAPALVDLRAGRIGAFFATILDIQPMLREGQARLLAITSRERVTMLPDLPAIAETLPGYEATFWQGLFAPAGTPQPILDRLTAALRVATTDATLRGQMAERGVVLTPGSAADLRDRLDREIESWGRLIREAGIRME